MLTLKRPAARRTSEPGSGTSFVKSAVMYILEVVSSGLYQTFELKVLPRPPSSKYFRSDTVTPFSENERPARSARSNPLRLSPVGLVGLVMFKLKISWSLDAFGLEKMMLRM